MKIENAYLTTKDNPYSYFSQYDEWLAFDESKGYFTNSLVARLLSDVPISQHYDVNRVVNEVEKVYFSIVSMLPDIYELREDI